MKHGPIALFVERKFLAIVAVPNNHFRPKVLSSIAEIRARDGVVLALAMWGDEDIKTLVDDVIYVPPVHNLLESVVYATASYLLAYHIALLRGCPIDKPCNLAKSVTME